MAYIKEIPIHQTVAKAIAYITKPEKTNGQTLIADSGIPFQFANKMWKNIREKYKKDDKILAHHFVQSFDPKHGITPAEALKIGKELAEKQFGRLGFDYIVATHIDKDVIHNHILVNNVSRSRGSKYYHNTKTYTFLRQLNIDVCRNNGIPAVDSPKLDELHEENVNDIPVNLGSRYKTKPYTKTKAYDSWTEKKINSLERIRNDIDETIKAADSWDDFEARMQKAGYKIEYKRKDGNDKKYITFFPQGAKKGIRNRSLGTDYYSKNAITKRINKEKELKNKKNVYELKNPYISRKILYPGKEYKQRYEMDPKWEKILFSLKSNYRRRSFMEEILIKTLFKKKNISSENERKESNEINKNYYQKSKIQTDKILKCIDYMKKENIHSQKDIDFKIFLLKENIDNQESNLLKKKEELLQVEIIIDELKSMTTLKPYFENYNSLSGKEKNQYYYKNKDNIQRYQLLKRKFKILGIQEKDLEKYIAKQAVSIQDLDQLQCEKEKIIEELKYLGTIERIIKSAAISGKVKISFASENKNREEKTR